MTAASACGKERSELRVSHWSGAVVRSDEHSSVTIDGAEIDDQGALLVDGTFRGTIMVGGKDIRGPEGNQVAAFAAKFSPAGRLAWFTRIGRPTDQSRHSLALDASGALWILRPGSFDKSNASSRYDLLKLDTGRGVVAWSRAWPPGLRIKAIASDRQRRDGVGLAVVGVVSGAVIVDGHELRANGQDMCVAMLDAGGTARWVRSYGGGMQEGGLTLVPNRRHQDNDGAIDVAFLPEQRFAVLGQFSTDVTIGGRHYGAKPEDQLVLVTFATGGSVLSSSPLLENAFRSMRLASIGRNVALLQGRQVSSYDLDGTRLWATTFFGPKDEGNLVALSSLGEGIVVAGSFAGSLRWAPYAARSESDVLVATIGPTGAIVGPRFISDGPSSAVGALATSPTGDAAIVTLERRQPSADVEPFAARIEVSHAR